MALEITELLKTKLDLLSCKDIYFPTSKSNVTQYIEELKTFQKILKGAEADNPIIEEWEKLLGNIYSLEDIVESLLSKTTLKSQKLLIGQVKLINKIGQLRGKVRQFLTTINLDGEQDQSRTSSSSFEDMKTQPSCPEDMQQLPTKESSSDPDDVTQVFSSRKISSNSNEYDKQVPTSSEATVIAFAPISEEDHERAVETDSSLTNKPEDLQPSPTLRRTYSIAQLRPRKLLSRKGSDRGFLLEDVDDEAPNAPGEIWADTPYSSEEKPVTDVLENLVNELAQPLLSPGTLQFLMLKADISCSGKAILLWTVYNAETVKQHFHFRAWIHVTEVSEEIDILKAIIKQVTNDTEEKEETLQSLQQRLRDFLVWGRYLIVLYGDRTDVLWDYLKSAFPYSLSGSRVIIAIPHSDGSKPMRKALNERPQQNLVESSVYLEDSSITIAKAIIDELAESILNPHRLLFLISVVGVVGSGKTTLLWPMYNAEDVKQHFQCRAWIHVPKGFKEEDVLNDILEQVTGVKTEVPLPTMLLRQKLRNFLAQKRYLVVLYDVWKAGIWEDVKLSLPNTLNGSRVILAVHEVDVAWETNSWIFKITSGKGLFHDFKGMKEIAPDAKHANRWFDKLSDIMDEASGIVGLRDKIQEQAQLILNSYKLHHLISVLGVAGSGKTTLVRAFYNSIAAKQHFDCRAWISVPQDFDERDILLDLFGQLRKAKEKQSLSIEQLQKGLRLFLTWKRYLIVLDDVRSPDIWNRLNLVLPNSSNGSRVIFTIRNTYLAYHMSPSSVVLALRPLDDEESWELFSKRVTGIDDMPPKLKEKILRRCRGLPLTILVLGGLLSNKGQNYKEWFQVIEETSKRGEKKKEITGKDQLDSGQSPLQKYEKYNVAMETQQASSSGKESSIEDISTSSVPLPSSKIKQKEEQKEATSKKKEDSKVVIDTSTSGEDQTDDILANTVAMSYRNLSFSSKCCLLYLGLFPQAYEIPIRRLFQLWLAEGLVIAPTGETSTREDLAKSCFEQLLNRNLIEIAKRRLDGSPKTCRVTNSLYDNLFPNAKKVGFFHIHSSSDTSLSQQSTIRRLAGHLEINPPVSCIRHLRSYISFCKKRGDAPTYGVNELLNNVVKGGFPMLAVLDLEGVYKPLLSETLGKLPKLKYLGLRRTLLDSIPESVGDLPHLETLDIKDTYITTLPGTLWKARKLQHLYMSEIYVDVSIQKQSAHGSLNSLQTLWGLIIRRKIPKKNWLDRLVGLRKLKLTCLEASIQVIASWIPILKNLESFKLRSISELNEPAQLELPAIRELMNLSRLYLLGKLPKPIDVSELPENLESLTLSVSQLSHDPMEMLGQLQKLKVLKLYARSFIGKEMTCHRDGFPQLQVLKLWMLEELVQWTVEENSMPKLKEVEIRCCKNLENIEGLQKLTTLKELMLTNMKPSFVEEVKQRIGSEIVFTQDLKFAAAWHVEENRVEQLG